MPSDRPSSTPVAVHDADTNATSGCAICGATDSLSEYSIDPSSDHRSAIELCPIHYHVAAVVSGARFQDTGGAPEYDLQETRKITVRVPRALIESADAAAEQQGQTRSELVRDGIQLAIEMQGTQDPFDDILAQAVHAQTGPDTEAETGPDTEAETDVEFLKERIRTLESLLEDSLEKI